MNIVLAQGGGGGFLIQLVPILAMVAIFYFLVIAPQRKRQKELEHMRNNLKNGDRVITEGGIYGTVSGINQKESTIHLLVAPSVKIEFSKNAIIGLREQPRKEGEN
ncbi:MAG: preprotein translocase subunit YajC [Chloracidobacterium sp.]|uniref:Sec translocon accessory complex subunit YajC n=1 Tax=Chloracidobacterium validum TaxID=2821543 RepID=A0ABX8B6D8_9BACT|nr:preprotein translocase subunit YajC [Chloracidobacterium validum]QUW02532.1 preprotein translocase subunit YajC [Chloracidobacterium validum]